MRKLPQIRPSTASALLAFAAAFVTAPQAARAVILYRSATRNTSPPTGQFLNSGWQWEGQFGGFLGTPIASQYFITANHIGGGFSLTYNGVTYPVDTSFGNSGGVQDPGTDLRIFKIQGTFPNWAPLYDTNVDGPEAGKLMAIFGRGTQRGAPVYGRYPSPSRDGGSGQTLHELKGWQWGPSDGVQSWGSNIAEGVFNAGQDYGTVLYDNFDRVNGLNDECSLSGGDSGGGVFLQTASGWKLGGINLAVDSPFKVAPDFPSFSADLFDYGGTYIFNGQTYDFVQDTAADVPGSSYASDISANLPWIHSIVGTSLNNSPEPSSSAALIVAGIAVLRRRRRSIS